MKTHSDWLYLDWMGFGFDRRQIKYFETINEGGLIGLRLKFLDGESKEVKWEGSETNFLNMIEPIVGWICESDKLRRSGIPNSAESLNPGSSSNFSS